MKLGWLIVPVVVVLAWCSTPPPSGDGGRSDAAPDGAYIQPRCDRVCAHFAASGCPQTDCAVRCRQTYVMAGDLCAPLYETYLACAETAPIACSDGGAIQVVDCEAPHGAAAACMGGPSDGGL